MKDDSADQIFEQFQDIVQQAILREFPNPERKGCPGTQTLRELANRPRPIRDSAWEHVTHCSPCFREFLDLRTEAKQRLELERRRAIRRRTALAAIAVVVAGGGIAAYEVFHRGGLRPSEGLGTYQPALLDLRDASTTRGAEGQGRKGQPHILPAKRLDLTILLPVGSEPGPYEIQFLKDIDKPLLNALGGATVENGTTVVRTKLDLSRKNPGSYLIGLRQPPSDWTFYPVTIE
jgi:hypothetical protein